MELITFFFPALFKRRGQKNFVIAWTLLSGGLSLYLCTVADSYIPVFVYDLIVVAYICHLKYKKKETENE